jgi:hypothetical protein
MKIEEVAMGRINWGRVILGGIAAVSAAWSLPATLASTLAGAWLYRE